MKEEHRQKVQVATAWMLKNFTREQNYLFVMQRDMEKYLNAFTADKFSSEEKREQLRWDFGYDFLSLRKRMQEFGWNKKFLQENSIPFKPLKNLFYRLFSESERISLEKSAVV